MGVDLVLYIAHRGTPLTEDEVRRMSIAMAVAIGPDYFFIDTRREPPQFALNIADPDWLGYELPAEIKSIPKSEFQLLKVNQSYRYYSGGFAQSSWPGIRTVLGCILHKFKDHDITLLYGSDNWFELEAFPPARIAEIDETYYSETLTRHQMWLKENLRCTICDVGLEYTGSNGELRGFRCPACGVKFTRNIYDGEAPLEMEPPVEVPLYESVFPVDLDE